MRFSWLLNGEMLALRFTRDFKSSNQEIQVNFYCLRAKLVIFYYQLHIKNTFLNKYSLVLDVIAVEISFISFKNNSKPFLGPLNISIYVSKLLYL